MASASFVRGASIDQEVAAECASLFRGITLPKEVADRARDIIARCVVDRNALPQQIAEHRPCRLAKRVRRFPACGGGPLCGTPRVTPPSVHYWSTSVIVTHSHRMPMPSDDARRRSLALTSSARCCMIRCS